MIVKQGVDISFAQGLDTKTDPKRVGIGSFTSLENSIFTKGGLLQKRNGFDQLTSLPNNNSSFLTTLNDNLTAIGTSINAYNESNETWVTKGNIQPLSLSTLPIIRNNLNQTACDSAVSANGLVCTAYLETNGNTTTNKYVIADAITGQNIVAPIAIPVASGAVSGGMRVFVLGSYFVIAFTNTISSTKHLQYIAISIQNPSIVTANADLASSVVSASTVAWDGFVANNNLYFAYNTTSGSQSVKVAILTSGLTLVTATTLSGYTATMMSVTADITTPTNPIIYVSFYNSGTTTGYTAVLDKNIHLLVNAVEIIASGTYLNLASAAQNGTCDIFGEVSNTYSWDNTLPTNFINKITISPLLTTATATFSSGASSITISSATGLVNGMSIVDNTTSANITAGTTFTKSGTTLSLSNNTAGNSAGGSGDTMAFATVVPAIVSVRSVGLASKAFIINGVIYYLAAFQSSYQPSYFLINGSTSTSTNPVIVSKLAYQNGGGYLTLGLPGVSINDSTTAQIAYLFKDLVQAVNKGTAVPAGTQVNGIYSQTGINLVTFDIGTQNFNTAEIANVLQLSGGFLGMYDGYNPVEHNFFLWPDTDLANPTAQWTFSDSAVTPTGTATSGAFTITLSSASGVAVGMTIADSSNSSYIPAGTVITELNGVVATMSQATIHAISGDTLSIAGQMASKPDGSTYTNAYYFQITYEWTDNQGNAYKSAPSIPIAVTTANNTDTSGSVTLSIPTLRLTAKTANPVKIVVYRWSVAQQIYYQVTSIIAPLLNSTTADTVTFIDAAADATILGNNILYTTGGVVEDVNAPATNIMDLFDTRLWMVDAEDPDLLWYSKQIIQDTPVEMSDLFTFYVPPTTGTEGSTGPMKCLFPMDDKNIIFKNNAIVYINGTGPDNTGANSQYSQPIFITSTVGCANQASIVLIPQGLLFQSNKGIWLLDRGLGTTYIGAPVENFTNTAKVVSAQNIPGTNQVRFILDSGTWLMYDYYYSQWGTFTGIPGISSCIYNELHTFIDSYGRVFQESPGTYLDGSNPVLISFTTGPLRLGALQNYQRAFFFYLMGQFYSPHKLVVSIAYDYSPNPSQTTILTPINYSSAYGSGPSQSPYGQGNPYGGPPALEQFRVFLERQRCQAFSISLEEVYDSTYGVPAGQGLSLSGINAVLGFKGQFPTVPSNISFG